MKPVLLLLLLSGSLVFADPFTLSDPAFIGAASIQVTSAPVVCAKSSEYQEVQNGDYAAISDFVVSQKIYNPATTTVCKIRIGVKAWSGTFHIDLRTAPNNSGTQIGTSSQNATAADGSAYVWYDCPFTVPISVTGDYYITIIPEGGANCPAGLNVTLNAYRPGYYVYAGSASQYSETLMFEVWTQ